MKNIEIDSNICRGCRLCRKSCPFFMIQIYDNVAHIDSGCKKCGRCVKSCPFGAIKEVHK